MHPFSVDALGLDQRSMAKVQREKEKDGEESHALSENEKSNSTFSILILLKRRMSDDDALKRARAIYGSDATDDELAEFVRLMHMAPTPGADGPRLPRGLRNPGLLCFLNSAVNMLFQVPRLTRRVLEYDGECAVTKAYAGLCKDLLDLDVDEPADPSVFWNCFRERFSFFDAADMHDATEVIVLLLDVFETSLGKDFVSSIFYGDVETTISALGVEGVHAETAVVVSQKTDTLVLVNLPATGVPGETLDDLVYNFSFPTELKDYRDDAGQVHAHAFMSSAVTRFPSAVIFVFGSANMPVDLPEYWRGRKLVCMILHVNNHYVSACCIKSKWFFKSDHTVVDLGYLPLMPKCYAALYDLRGDPPPETAEEAAEAEADLAAARL